MQLGMDIFQIGMILLATAAGVGIFVIAIWLAIRDGLIQKIWAAVKTRSDS